MKWGQEAEFLNCQFGSGQKNIRRYRMSQHFASGCMLKVILAILIVSALSSPCIDAQQSSTANAGSSEAAAKEATAKDAAAKEAATKEAVKKIAESLGPQATKQQPEQSTKQPEQAGPTGVGVQGQAAKDKQLSVIERLIAGQIPDVVSTNLSQFGYDVFQRPVSTFAPVTDVPVGPDYILGSWRCFYGNTVGQDQCAVPGYSGSGWRNHPARRWSSESLWYDL